MDSYVQLCSDKFAAVRAAAVSVVDLIAPDSNFVASQLTPRLLKMFGTSKLFKNRVIVLSFAKVCDLLCLNESSWRLLFVA